MHKASKPYGNLEAGHQNYFSYSTSDLDLDIVIASF